MGGNAHCINVTYANGTTSLEKDKLAPRFSVEVRTLGMHRILTCRIPVPVPYIRSGRIPVQAIWHFFIRVKKFVKKCSLFRFESFAQTFVFFKINRILDIQKPNNSVGYPASKKSDAPLEEVITVNSFNVFL